MADKGFLIQDLLDPLGVTLNMPQNENQIGNCQDKRLSCSENSRRTENGKDKEF